MNAIVYKAQHAVQQLQIEYDRLCARNVFKPALGPLLSQDNEVNGRGGVGNLRKNKTKESQQEGESEKEEDAEASFPESTKFLFQTVNRLVGVTGFRVRSTDGAPMLGIRFDISPQLKPDYVILRPRSVISGSDSGPSGKLANGSNETGSTGQASHVRQTRDNNEEGNAYRSGHEVYHIEGLEIFQHTLPSFLPIRKLEREHLNLESPQVGEFVKKVRRELVKLEKEKRTQNNE